MKCKIIGGGYSTLTSRRRRFFYTDFYAQGVEAL